MNIALLLSGGTGTRFGSEVPKQYLHVSDKMLITWTLNQLCQCSQIDGIQVVAAKDYHAAIEEEKPAGCVLTGFSEPGETRQESILNGLKDLVSLTPQTVLIHDAARPMISPDLVSRCYAALPGHDGVMPVLPMTDTVYYSESGKEISRLINRNYIYAGQAPELFLYRSYLAACQGLRPNEGLNIRGSSEVAFLAGLDITLIPGDKENIKITTKEDMELFRLIYLSKKG